MQCACPDCGILMSWDQKGLESQCVCPECRLRCKACLGTNSVRTVDELKLIYSRDLESNSNGDAHDLSPEQTKEQTL